MFQLVFKHRFLAQLSWTHDEHIRNIKNKEYQDVTVYRPFLKVFSFYIPLAK